jgi:hypothetical protein
MPEEETITITHCALCHKQANLVVTAARMKVAQTARNFRGFICDDCFMEHVEPEGGIQ